MSTPGAFGRPSRGTILWTLAAAILVDGCVRPFAGSDAVARAALLGFLLGALPLTSGLLGRRLRPAILEPLLGGLATSGASILTHYALPVVASGIGLVLGAALGWLLRPLFELLGIEGVSVHALALGTLGVVALLSGGTAGRLRTLIGVEWLKLRKSRLLRVSVALAAAATLLTSLTHAPVAEEGTGWTQAASSMGVGFGTAEILLFVLAATTVAGEVSQGTMKMILPHAYRRAEWISAKAVVLLLTALLFALVVTSVGAGHTLLVTGLGDVTREAPAGFGQENTVEVFETAAVMRDRLLQMAVVSTAGLAASALVGLLLSCLFHGLVAALSAAFLVFAVLKTGKTFLGLTPTTLELFYTWYPDELRRLTEQFGRAVNDSWDALLHLRGLYLAMLTGVLALLASLRLFGRRDLHG